MTLKNVCLKFIGLGINDMYQADIIIYDNLGNIVCKCKTYNASVVTCLKENNNYKIKACMQYETLESSFYVNNNDTYYFVFNRAYLNNNQRLITFYLKDYYYNLPIERGILYWQNK